MLVCFSYYKLYILKWRLTNLIKKGYYGYLYSRVFAEDMYTTVCKKDPYDSELGEKYKRSILGPGGSQEELDSLTVCCGVMLHDYYCTIGADCL